MHQSEEFVPSSGEESEKDTCSDIETNFTIEANALSSPEHNTAFGGPALEPPGSPEPALQAPLSPDPYSLAPPSPEVP